MERTRWANGCSIWRDFQLDSFWIYVQYSLRRNSNLNHILFFAKPIVSLQAASPKPGKQSWYLQNCGTKIHTKDSILSSRWRFLLKRQDSFDCTMWILCNVVLDSKSFWFRRIGFKWGVWVQTHHLSTKTFCMQACCVSCCQRGL